MNHHYYTKKIKNNGFSLLEILLTVALGTILMLGLARIYLGMKNTHRHQESMARLQENARTASAILAKSIHTAGYLGYDSYNLPNFLRNKNILNNTDVIVIQKADSNITHLTKNVSPPTNKISVENNPASINNLWLSISDCTTNNIFQADNYVGKTINSNAPIRHIYKKSDTEVASFTEIAYFVSEASYKDEDGKPVYSLYSLTNGSKNPGANKQELIAGVKNMKITYGLDTDNDGTVDSYYSADQISTWDKVRSIAITLQLEERREHKQWQIYIALRERMV
jgi:type IV pilus assembly protein PilW